MNRPQLKSGGVRLKFSKSSKSSKSPLLVAIGGLDPSGGAGVVRDVLVAGARGARPHVVGTAWTEQGEGLHRVEPRAPAALENAVRHAVSLGPGAVKVGMVPGAEAAAAVVRGLGTYPGPVVVDPVLATSRGGALFAGDPAGLLPLLARATLATPNAPETAALTGLPVEDLAGAEAAGRLLLGRGLAAVLVKGGHIGHPPAPVTDLLVTAAGVRRFEHARVPGRGARGTGCTLATAIAVELARGAGLAEAVETAGAWLAEAIANADERGHLP